MADRVNTPQAAPEAPPAAAPAEEAAPAAAAPAASGGIKAWLPLIVTVVAMPALAYAMTSFVLLPRLQTGLGITPPPAAESAAKSAKKNANAKKESVAMNKLLVNVAGTMGGRYLLVSLSLVSDQEGFKEKVAEFEPQLKDMACGALAAKTMADLEKPGVRNLIRAELISGFNNILGGAMVQDIYLTEFAIQ